MGLARTVIVHRHRIVAEVLSRRLAEEPGIRVLEIVSSVGAARTAVGVLGPDVVVLDMGLDDGSSYEFAAWLTGPDGRVRVVSLVDAGDTTAAVRSIRAGASAVATKDGPAADLVEAVLAAADDGGYVPAPVLGVVLAEFRASVPPPNEFDERLARLTQRECEVLALMVEGCDRATIARELLLSVGTVRTHTRHILAKLEVHSSLEAVSVARRACLGVPTPA